MTLSGWLRDYVYISAGGNRHGKVRTWANLMLTMLLGGLWHGASWNFVIWGGFHGAVLSLERMIWGKRVVPGVLRIPFTVLTFLVVNVGWVFFRAKTLTVSVFVVGQMFSGALGKNLFTTVQMELAGVTLVVALGEEYLGVLTHLAQAPAWLRTATVVMTLLAIELFTASDQSLPFVYFQF